MKTYQNILDILLTNGDLFVPVFYVTGTYEWLKVDEEDYIKCVDGIYDKTQPYPCCVEIELDGDIFIHPKLENR